MRWIKLKKHLLSFTNSLMTSVSLIDHLSTTSIDGTASGEKLNYKLSSPNNQQQSTHLLKSKIYIKCIYACQHLTHEPSIQVHVQLTLQH